MYDTSIGIKCEHAAFIAVKKISVNHTSGGCNVLILSDDLNANLRLFKLRYIRNFHKVLLFLAFCRLLFHSVFSLQSQTVENNKQLVKPCNGSKFHLKCHIPIPDPY